ncbi:ABC transporter permease [Actinoallomurus purpureus]|uniref:ABC transporter permease n=1 Tax=Actinoallomurus purpureus TaxID=478114 RepID=UPI002092D803|nr:ABC transporter permease [Actinoallomurus purpureus]MCO6003804.1 ABC transporter permease [Actinoallomurus purpureus]
MATDVHPVAEVARVRVARRSLRHDLRAVKIVLHRELLRFLYDRTRMISQLVQPVLWLLIMGTGLSSLVASGGGVNLKTFIFPGVIAMSVMFTAMFSAASIVWDREFGFLREMLVAPVSRAAIVVGKVLGGAIVATFQGIVILALAGLVGVPYDPVMLVLLVLVMFIGAFTITAFGVVLAARIKKMQSFFGIMQMAMMPMLFLSGALFPLSGLPGWLNLLTRINPLTYAVDPLRHVVFAHIKASPALLRRFNPGVTWFGWHVPPALEVVLVLVLGVVLLGAAVAQFRRTD